MQPTQPTFQFTDYGRYFDSAGVLRVEYLTTWPEAIAELLEHEEPQLTMTQLRAFYQHAKRAEDAWRRKRLSPAEAVNEVKKLGYHANDRLGKKRIPQTFHDFVRLNVESVKADDDGRSLKAFLEHFEALVGFCAGRLDERERI